MTIVNKEGYICPSIQSYRNSKRRYIPSIKDFWIVKYLDDYHVTSAIILGRVIIPEEYVGKRVRFKIEVLK